MAGMKIRFTRIRNLASSKAKGATYGILLFLAFAVVPKSDSAQDKPGVSGSSQQSSPAPGPQNISARDTTKGSLGGAVAKTPPAGVLKDVTIAPVDGSLTVTVTTVGLLAPTEFTLDKPPRLVLDFPNTENKVKFTRLPVHASSVKQVRVQQFQSAPSPIARVVFDLEEDSGAHEMTVDKNLVRLVFHKGQPKSNPPGAGATAKLAPSPADNSAKAKSPAVQPSRAVSSQPSKAAVVESAAKTPAAAQPGAPSGSKPIKAAIGAADLKPLPAESAAKTPAASAPQAAAQPGAPSGSKPTKAAIGAADQKPLPAESAAKTPAASVPAAAAPPKPARPEPVKTAVASTNPKPHPVDSALKGPAASTPSTTVPDALPRSEPTKAATGAADSKPLPAESAASSATVRQERAQSELTKTVGSDTNPKPRPVESAAKDSPTPLVAALPSVPAAAPRRTISSPNSRFSGQPLTLDLIDVPLVDFFRLMAEEGGINIVLDPEVKGHLSIKVVKVPWDQILEAALANNGLDKQVEGSLVRIARKSTLQDEAKQQEALKKANLLAADLETRIKRLNYAKATTMVATLADQKTARGIVVVDERTNSLILTDLPSSLNKLVQLIEALDVPQPQVEIEARIVSATRNFARDIGVQLGFVQGNLQRVTVGGPNTFGTIGGTRPSATPSETITAGNLLTGRGNPETTSSQSAGTSTGTTSNNQGNWNVNLPAQNAFGGIGLSVGNIFDTFLLDAAITAGETKGLAKLISQPRVIAQNNNPAIITQGMRFPVQIVANNTVTVQFQNAALTLTVTPQITYEGNIVLDLKVENNTADFANAVNNIPSIRTSESTTRVLVSDGGTTVIGGILLDNDSTQEDKVPGLGSLPLLGNLFRRSSITRSTQEVLFFVTPRIIK
jgi:type IV pilus assembly protein PilQ